MQILGIAASPRKNANSTAMVQAALAGAEKAGANTELVQLRDYMYSSCIGCEKCRTDKKCTGLSDGMTLLYPKIEAAKGIILASPVHFYNVTALMKAFIDRLYCYFDFDMENRPRAWSSRLAGQGRKAVVMTVGEQADEEDMGVTMQALRLSISCLDYEITDEVQVMAKFDTGLVRRDEEDSARCEQAGRELAQALGTV
jgi:multimeric flavodoxin WrbA